MVDRRLPLDQAEGMDQEQRWLREHGRKLRLRKMEERKRRLMGLAIATLLRQVFAMVSILIIPLLLISVVLNWGKLGPAYMVDQLALSVLCLVVLNGGVWLNERLFRRLAGVK